MSIYLHFDYSIEELVTNSCSRDKVTINWSKASDCDILYYRNLTYNYLHKLNIQSAMKCTDINCKSFDHCEQIDTLYSQICNVLRQSSIESVPSSKIHDSRDYIVPGFNEFAKELLCTARDAYIAWRDAGRPRSGDLCSDMRSSRLRFKYTLRICRQNEQAIRANAHAKALLEKDMLSFWKGVKKENNSRLPNVVFQS